MKQVAVLFSLRSNGDDCGAEPRYIQVVAVLFSSRSNRTGLAICTVALKVAVLFSLRSNSPEN